MANEVIINKEVCKGCALCVSVCPKKVLELDKKNMNAKGYHPSCAVNIDDCIACGMCAVMCPDSAIKVVKVIKE